MAFKPQNYSLIIDKLIHGGQGLGTLESGKKALVWNALPGEKVIIETRKSKSKYIEGIATEIIEPSSERVQAKDSIYLSTSPWQMMTYEAENKYKKEILIDSLNAQHIDVENIDIKAPEQEWSYRNKMEYSFYGNEEGIHLALFNRGSHQKQIVSGSSLAKSEIDLAAEQIKLIVNKLQLRASDLKSVVIRSNKKGDSAAALFTKKQDFPAITDLPDAVKGLGIYFSNPKSPASVVTKTIKEYGDVMLEDTLLDSKLQYHVLSFFQVNLPIYEKSLKTIKSFVSNEEVTDMYAGVGSIGLTVANSRLKLVELDQFSADMAKRNAEHQKFDSEVITAAAEKSLEFVPTGKKTALIVDPPRAGLHPKLIDKILEKLPQKVIYLSCNPSTFARDIALLQDNYAITKIEGYNFFPKTPHIEALALLECKS